MKTNAKVSGYLLLMTFACALSLISVAGAATVQLPLTQAHQHKDTNMSCTPGASAAAHTWNHAVNPAPGCAHCAYYCVPASVSMYAAYRGRSGQYVQQDKIYDQGKSTSGETAGDGTLQTHGVGMFDLAPPHGPADEVGDAFTWAIASPYKWGPVSLGFPGLSGSFVIQCIDDNIPILWCDHHGWPDDIFPQPDSETLDYNGHAKIIAGYNDNGTAVIADDLYWIYDPWPTASSPSWVSATSVLDNRDVYYADYSPVANEPASFGSVKALYR